MVWTLLFTEGPEFKKKYDMRCYSFTLMAVRERYGITLQGDGVNTLFTESLSLLPGNKGCVCVCVSVCPYPGHFLQGWVLAVV